MSNKQKDKEKIKLATDKQKKHYQRYLAQGEEVVAVFGIGDRYFWYSIFSYILIVTFLLGYPQLLLLFPQFAHFEHYRLPLLLPGLLAGLIGLPFVIKLVHLRHKMTYILTDRRLLIKDGVFSVKTTSAPYDKITHLTVREDFLKKISYQIGDIVVHTAGPTPIETDIVKVQYPMHVKNLLEELMIKERSLLGIMDSSDQDEPLVKPLS